MGVWRAEEGGAAVRGLITHLSELMECSALQSASLESPTTIFKDGLCVKHPFTSGGRGGVALSWHALGSVSQRDPTLKASDKGTGQDRRMERPINQRIGRWTMALCILKHTDDDQHRPAPNKPPKRFEHALQHSVDCCIHS